jgi:GNAT superfamily N-acetyltransferase
MPVTWEKFKPSDTDELLRLMAEFCRVAHLPWAPDTRKQNIAEFKNGDIWFIILDGKKIGYAVNVFGFSFEFGGRVAFIDEFYIEEGHQRKGVGQQTLDFIAQHETQKRSVVLFLEASDSESHLHAFYESSGLRGGGTVSILGR